MLKRSQSMPSSSFSLTSRESLTGVRRSKRPVAGNVTDFEHRPSSSSITSVLSSSSSSSSIQSKQQRPYQDHSERRGGLFSWGEKLSCPMSGRCLSASPPSSCSSSPVFLSHSSKRKAPTPRRTQQSATLLLSPGSHHQQQYGNSEHWNSFHKRYHADPHRKKMPRIYLPGWSHSTERHIFDEEQHREYELQKKKKATKTNHHSTRRIVTSHHGTHHHMTNPDKNKNRIKKLERGWWFPVRKSLARDDQSLSLE
jgi:hypothetical protein